MLNKNKRGQITIFIIVGIVVVAVAVLIYLFYPEIKAGLGFETKNPSEFIQDCLQEEIEKNIALVSLQGGSLNPEHYILYNGEKVEYLCYTREYYKLCVMQQPLLKRHIENEIENVVEGKAEECFNELKQSYEKKNFDVELKKGDSRLELLPKRIVMTFDHSLSLTKDSTERFEEFEVILNNNLYELVSIANSILNWEASYGDSETTTYMSYYPDLKVEKKKQTDGTTVYILTDRNNENKFQFASRSVAWPPGYGINDILI
ncbi:hypothetical protein ACFL0X_00705 [Nanoarchaeota archaeon]